MHRSLPFVLSVLLAGASVAQGEECTVGVACGKATADGRPLLWKNRDAHQRDNVVMALADGKVPYFALCDAGNPAAVWGGANVAGFGVVSAVSRDLPEASAAGPDNGAFAKLALQRCTTIAEFETLLKETAGARRTRANFGVIDAAGGASFFEVGPERHERFDAAASSDGMLVRTNFATSAGGAGERGRERFARAEALCRSAPGKPLTCRFLLQQFLRDLQPPPSAAKGDAGRQDARETIHRQTTVAGLVIAGTAPGEDTRWTTMWTLLGQPLFTIVVPLWPAAAAVPRDLAGDPRSALCDASKRFQDAFYEPGAAAAPAGADAAEADASPALRWLRIDRLPLARRTLLFTEADLLARVEERLEQWRAPDRDPPTPAAMRAFQELLTKQALDGVTRLARQFAVAAK